MPLIEYSCLNCNKIIKRYIPNYDNKWSEEQKQQQSERMKKEMGNPERRYISGNANRGKSFSEDTKNG